MPCSTRSRPHDLIDIILMQGITNLRSSGLTWQNVLKIPSANISQRYRSLSRVARLLIFLQGVIACSISARKKLFAHGCHIHPYCRSIYNQGQTVEASKDIGLATNKWSNDKPKNLKPTIKISLFTHVYGLLLEYTVVKRLAIKLLLLLTLPVLALEGVHKRPSLYKVFTQSHQSLINK